MKVNPMVPTRVQMPSSITPRRPLYCFLKGPGSGLFFPGRALLLFKLSGVRAKWDHPLRPATSKNRRCDRHTLLYLRTGQPSNSIHLPGIGRLVQFILGIKSLTKLTFQTFSPFPFVLEGFLKQLVRLFLACLNLIESILERVAGIFPLAVENESGLGVHRQVAVAEGTDDLDSVTSFGHGPNCIKRAGNGNH